jgi:hypothetical protein
MRRNLVAGLPYSLVLSRACLLPLSPLGVRVIFPPPPLNLHLVVEM